ncbi:hypothetical protein K1T71_013895 [Dendrolimus kikuchii]|uniref:Uncharacterized protein n=1 Tax=Dendrolimus kikuchii TaxID=765133 RepID=A0ACC1CG30_9NEOP|nr:hypothetical protein K1T71_013895 [Dendrolimus kikuchii]
MSATIDQKAYLQKYLGGPSKDKKKKKKAIKGKGFKIIDDDIDLSKLRPLDGDEIDLLDEGEDGPQIAGIIDERPEEVKKLEQFKTTSKWKVVTQDDGFNSKLQIQEIKLDIKEVEKENEIIFGKMYSDSEDEKEKDSKASPPRKSKNIKDKISNDNSPQRKRDRNISQSPVRKEQANDSDPSPPRKSSKVGNQTSSKKHDSDSDFSPPRKRDRNLSQSTLTKKQQGNDTDLSPPRKHDSRPKNKQRKASRWGDFENQKELNKEQDKSDSDQSLPRKSSKNQRDDHRQVRYAKESDSDPSPPRKSRKSKSYDHKHETNFKESRIAESSDESPSRKNKHSPQKNFRSQKYDYKNEKVHRNPAGEKYRRSTTPDTSQRQRKNYSEQSLRRKRSMSPKRSPQRQNRHPNEKKISTDYATERNKIQKRYDSNDRQTDVSNVSKGSRDRFRSPVHKRSNSDSDQSPPRRKDNRRNNEFPNKTDNYRKDSERSSNKMAKTLEGKKAGLQDAKQLKEENEQFRRKEDEVFTQMADEVSGRNAQVVSRKSKRETSEERRKKKEKSEKQKELDAKYQKWNRGLKQIQDQESRVNDFLHESSKPLARFKDDRDLETSLKDVERDGDPMLQYIRERKRECGELPPEKPSYKGSFPPNRFNIRPGYRWDGVDRSNGYEKKYFDQQSKRKAQEEEAYKWSTEDL